MGSIVLGPACPLWTRQGKVSGTGIAMWASTPWGPEPDGEKAMPDIEYSFGTGQGAPHVHHSEANVDVNGDGVADGVALDFDGDGRVDDVMWDSDGDPADRKSTRLNSSHLVISYAVFCLKKQDTLTAKGH